MIRVRTLLVMVLFVSFFIQSSELVQTCNPVENKEKESLLCRLFGIEQRWLSLTSDLQYLIVKHLEEKYPEAFFHTTVTEPVKSWPAHKHVINFLALIDDGKKLISNADDSCLFVWEAQSGLLLHTIDDPEKESLAVSHDQQKIAISQGDLVTIRNHPGFNIVQELNLGYRALLLQFFKNSTMLLTASRNRMVKPIKLWDLSTGACKDIRHTFPYLTYAASINQEGTLLATILGKSTNIFSGAGLYLWNIVGEPQLILEHPLSEWHSNLDFITADKVLVNCQLPIIWDLKLNQIFQFVESCTLDSYFCDNRFLEELARESSNYKKTDSSQFPYWDSQQFIFGKNIFFMKLPKKNDIPDTFCIWDIPSGKKTITLKPKEEGSFLTACLYDQVNRTIYAAVHFRNIRTPGRKPDVIRIWRVPETPRSFLENRLTLKKALFIMFFASKMHYRLHSKDLATSLKEELDSIFKTFTETERAYLLSKYALLKPLFSL